jgi:hypothetical protein
MTGIKMMELVGNLADGIGWELNRWSHFFGIGSDNGYIPTKAQSKNKTDSRP